MGRELLSDGTSLEQYTFVSHFHPHEIKQVGDGIELKREYQNAESKSSSGYENRCFATLISSPGRTLLLGPHLIDKLLGVGNLGYRSRPDGIRFDTSEVRKWKLEELYEFKSVVNRQVNRKLAGFSELLAYFRSNPSLLPYVLQSRLQLVLPIPDEIFIPNNEDVSVVFLSPARTPYTWKNTSHFIVDFRRV